uniref:Methyl-CpG-binding domain protein 2 n=1 Tax=Trichogramma kaykai TaxID=54128 RepID=A0ABD2X8X3_9HYME
MNMSIDKKKYYGQAAMPYWNQREEHQIPRKSNNNQPQQQQQQQQQQQAPLATAPQQLTTASKDPYYYSRPVKQDVSLLAPIRQTASIFKQPVTIIKNHKSVVKDLPNRLNEKDKPKQLFWEKRLEGLRACDSKGYELSRMELPKVLKPIGPYVSEETVLQSVATALHVGSGPVTGQTALKAQLEKNPGSFLNPDQPLLQAVTITDEDIKKQEEKVLAARQRLQEVLRY